MRVEVGVATDIGRVRERNEDTYLVEPPLYAIADGMGGARGGAVASGIAIDELETGAEKDKASLADLVRAANRAVFERSMTDRAVAGMGTTLTAARIDEDGAHLAHVGDSRAYLLRGGAFRQLTDDHTLVNRMVKAGEITREEAEVHPHRNVLTRSVGTEPDVEVDEDDVPLIDGDRLLLCSDGLTDMVTRDQIQAILETTSTAQEAADRLIKAANRAGGIDNTTVVVIAIHEGDELAAAGAPERGDARERGPEGSSGTIVARRPSNARVKRWALRAGIVVVALAAVAFVARFYVDRQWYVGESNGHVAVYQGIPAQFAGLRLSHVDVETDLPAAEVTRLPVYQDLPNGITANDRSDALAIVEQMRTDLATSGGGS
jgi:serine/threonine protein phosphatase PrpC